MLGGGCGGLTEDDDGGTVDQIAELVEMEVKHRCAQLVKLGIRMGGLTSMYAREWEGNINIVMPVTLSKVIHMTLAPSHAQALLGVWGFFILENASNKWCWVLS